MAYTKLPLTRPPKKIRPTPIVGTFTELIDIDEPPWRPTAASFAEHRYRSNLAQRWWHVNRSQPLRVTMNKKDVIHRYGGMRCMSGGLPTYMAETLLKGLRAPVGMYGEVDLVKLKSGRTVSKSKKAVNALTMVNCGLMDAAPVSGNRKARATTNYYGYVLLKYWAEHRKVFGPFLTAYATKNIEKKLKTLVMLED